MDAPGHGSADSKRGLDCAEAGSEIISAAGHGDFLGYSMGARILLAGAVARPELVRRLVLISGTAGIADQAERHQRRDLDQVRADALMRTGVEAFMEEWLAMEMFADLPVWARFERQRLANTAEGLADSLRTCGTGSMDPLWDRIGSLEMPVLCVAGGNDSKFCDLARQMTDAIGDNAEVAIIAETGHATHLEAPSRCAELVLDFLS